MKITVKSKQATEKKIVYNEIEPGTIFEYVNGEMALKLQYNEAALLKYMSGGDWFGLAIAYKTVPIKKILGRLDEIIVVEDDS